MKYAAILVLAVAGLKLAALGLGNGVEQAAARMTGGDPARGEAAIRRYGCGACHTIPGIRAADGLVGPSLDRIASRTYIAGVLVNSPDHMKQWIKNPPGVDPRTAMPNLRVQDEDLNDLAAYLYTLR
jgi:cytochrome c2